MAASVYKLIELVGTSTECWERAATAAVQQAAKSLRDLRIAGHLFGDVLDAVAERMDAARAAMRTASGLAPVSNIENGKR